MPPATNFTFVVVVAVVVVLVDSPRFALPGGITQAKRLIRRHDYSSNIDITVSTARTLLSRRSRTRDGGNHAAQCNFSSLKRDSEFCKMVCVLGGSIKRMFVRLPHAERERLSLAIGHVN